MAVKNHRPATLNDGDENKLQACRLAGTHSQVQRTGITLPSAHANPHGPDQSII